MMTFSEVCEAACRELPGYVSVTPEFTRYSNGRRRLVFSVYHGDIGSVQAEDPELALKLALCKWRELKETTDTTIEARMALVDLVAVTA